jgi:transposase-like protein
LACSYCQAVGTLTWEWHSKDTTCPRCRADELIATAGWIT